MLDVADTILVDELRKGHTTPVFDTVGDIAAISTQHFCHVSNLKLAVSEKLPPRRSAFTVTPRGGEGAAPGGLPLGGDDADGVVTFLRVARSDVSTPCL